MPADLFAQTVAPSPRRSKSRWTIAGSFGGHVALIAALVIAPIVSSVDGPDIVSRLEAFVVHQPPPLPPPPSSPPPSSRVVPPEVNLDAAPVTAPDGIAPEPPPMSAGPVIPGSASLTGSGRASPVVIQSTPGFGPPPPPRPRDPIRPGGVIQAPQRLSYVPPVYPEIARHARVAGTVILEAVIDEAGIVRDVRVLRSIELLDRAAIEAVSRWRYTPTKLNGVAVRILLTVSVTFSLQ